MMQLYILEKSKRKKYYLLLVIVFSFFYINSSSQTQRFRGWPSKNSKLDVSKGFKVPPKGYGNVPFYWWNGDSLTYEKLKYQLNLLKESATDGFAVSYIHSHPQVDKELNKKGYGGFGRTEAGLPVVFSDKWWNLWNWFSGECAKNNMAVGLDDYTLGWAKNGYYTDEILDETSFANYQGRLHITTHKLEKGGQIDIDLPDNTITVVAYPGKIDLKGFIKGKKLLWRSNLSQPCSVYIINTKPSPELHPDYGKRMIQVYFDRFAKSLDKNGENGMNYFFQDELVYNLKMDSWSDDFSEEFFRRKGYDILPLLPALWQNIGENTTKVRLDYAQVITELSEERYFKPIFDWHNDRGLIYGCDNFGRGMEPTRYVDYFRISSWFTAPGNDAPARGSSFIQTKVSSSVSHLYQRPRTWLEAFHSMGWDSSGEWLTEQLDHHMIAGGNLVCMHGLYYSTHGGWWEWAPPCFHFRMPYWPHMKKWLEYAERQSYLLSQGTHICDIAVLYPTETMQAHPEIKTNVWGNIGEYLSKNGLDYDYLDYHSLQNVNIEGKTLAIADEKYKIIILPDMKAMHRESLEKVLTFYRNGGIVIAMGSLPSSSTFEDNDKKQVENMMNEIFGQGTGLHVANVQELKNKIHELIIPDFNPLEGEGRVLHRKIGDRDVYMVTNVTDGTQLFFRAKGKVELWDAESGEIKEQPIIKTTDEGTFVRFNGEKNVSRLFVFSEGVPTYEKVEGLELASIEKEIPLNEDWDITLHPTMNNKWGDFRLPATDEMIGAEARSFKCLFKETENSKQKEPKHSEYTTDEQFYGYGPHMEMLVLARGTDVKEYIEKQLNEEGVQWQPYYYSWQYGVFDSPGSQGYHGLKGKVDNGFLILDKEGGQLFRTNVYTEKSGKYRFEKTGIAPNYIYIDNKEQNTETINLEEGWHTLILAYVGTQNHPYNLKQMQGSFQDNRPRSAVVLYPLNKPTPKDISTYSDIISSKWNRTDFAPYDIKGGVNGNWFYHFETAPGTCRMELVLKGELKHIWIDGKLLSTKNIKKLNDKLIIEISNQKKGVSFVT